MLATIGIVASGKGSSFPPAGELLSTGCGLAYGYDAAGQYWDGYAYMSVGTYADGVGGTYNENIGENTNGCHYPAGFAFGSSSTDASVYWEHGVDAGTFIFGNETQYERADGVGGYYTTYDFDFSVPQGAIMHEYVEGQSNFVLRFDRVTQVGVPYEYPVAGDLIGGDNCTTLNNYEDAQGSPWTVPAIQNFYTDGYGGQVSSIVIDAGGTCGYLPNGYAINYEATPIVLDYSIDTVNYEWQYAELQSLLLADGTGGSYAASGTNILYEAGYLFDQWNAAPNGILYYYFDGTNGYYTSY